ncbi:molybdopterin molybdotransferase MoeA [Caulobacter sp. AP07]|uniref:molybdopterin molybdotransferase MoeA n=1 Tax=Caulobacter sp. AP07 TaxID=1144304 RepID=UPI0006912232|nr:molybdopterin molybdotransferase MoeA [Caulobacter sp. AP07]
MAGEPLTCAAPGLPSYDEALGRLLGAVSPLEAEAVGLEAGHGRVLAQPVFAARARPAAALSAMDGYAIASSDLLAMRDGLKLVGAAYPGAPFVGRLQPGQAVRVTTGATLPDRADRVIVDEATSAAGGEVRLVAWPGDKAHVRPAGSDFSAGAPLLPVGSVLGPGAMMAAAAAEATTLTVVRRPRVRLLVTGDEIAPPSDAARRTPDSVSYGVAALIQAWGGEVVDRTYCKDVGEILLDAVRRQATHADVLVIVGGASRSERDLGRSAAGQAGATLLFEGVRMRPGKPVWAAVLADRLIVGLPGNPTAALVAARVLLAPAIAALAGRDARAALDWSEDDSVLVPAAAADRDLFLLAERRADGTVIIDKQEASGHAALTRANALVHLRQDGADRTADPAMCLPL